MNALILFLHISEAAIQLELLLNTEKRKKLRESASYTG